MLQIIAELVMEKVIQRVNDCICYSVQLDGSVDRQQSDNKFSTLRYIEADGSLHNVFLGVSEPTQNGANGLLEAVRTAIKNVVQEKFMSLTTDGESSNTGSEGGLWALLESEFGRKLLKIWCNCHRSDLALEDIENDIPELKTWKADAIAVSSYFRQSKCRTKLLNELADAVGIKILGFPAHHEIRFAEHGESLLRSILRNLPACRKVWKKIIDSPSDYTRKEIAKASDFLNTWSNESLKFKLTAFMHDIYSIFTSLQKGLQKSFIILPDVITLRDAAVRKFDVVAAGPMPGGEEEKALRLSNDRNQTIRSHLKTLNRDAHYDEIRSKVARKARDFVGQRLDVECEKSMESMKNILTAPTCETLIDHSVESLKQFIRSDEEDKISQLVSDICEQWPVLKDVQTLDTSDVGCKYSVRLRQLFSKSTGIFQWLLGIFAVACPHSMATERVVSHYNEIKPISRQNMDLTTVSQRLTISMNGSGTAHFDPRDAVAAFLQKKERRFRPADTEIYKTHDFTRKFFRVDTTV